MRLYSQLSYEFGRGCPLKPGPEHRESFYDAIGPDAALGSVSFQVV